jgi:hypothetical protein
MSLVIASQLEPDFNAALAQLPIRPTLIPVPDGQPWQAARDADVLIVRPGADWRAARHRGPKGCGRGGCAGCFRPRRGWISIRPGCWMRRLSPAGAAPLRTRSPIT